MSSQESASHKPYDVIVSFSQSGEPPRNRANIGATKAWFSGSIGPACDIIEECGGTIQDEDRLWLIASVRTALPTPVRYETFSKILSAPNVVAIRPDSLDLDGRPIPYPRRSATSGILTSTAEVANRIDEALAHLGQTIMLLGHGHELFLKATHGSTQPDIGECSAAYIKAQSGLLLAHSLGVAALQEL